MERAGHDSRAHPAWSLPACQERHLAATAAITRPRELRAARRERRRLVYRRVVSAITRPRYHSAKARCWCKERERDGRRRLWVVSSMGCARYHSAKARWSREKERDGVVDGLCRLWVCARYNSAKARKQTPTCWVQGERDVVHGLCPLSLVQAAETPTCWVEGERHVVVYGLCRLWVVL